MTKDTQTKAKRAIRNSGQYADSIRKHRLKAGLTQPQLAEMIGVTKNAISNWEAGLSRPDIDKLPQLCDALNVSADELLGRSATAVNAAEQLLLRKFRRLSPYDQKSFTDFMDLMYQNRTMERREYCRHTFMPLSIAPYAMGAGLGEPLGDNTEQERIFVRVTHDSSRADRVVRVNGDSMMPTFRDGDLLLVQETDQLHVGDIGIFIVAGEGFVKEYQRDGLHSHNKRYDTFMPADDDNSRCIGRVIGRINDAMLPDDEETRILEEVFA